MADRQYTTYVEGIGPVCIDSFGGDEFVIQVGGKDIRFEWSEMFGPMPITKTGAGRHLPHNHPFWRAASLWNLQKRRVVDGKAIWHEPRKPVYEIKGRTITKVIDEGEEGHDW